MTDDRSMSSMVRFAGHAGWLPFLMALLVVSVSTDDVLRATVVRLSLGWAALILAFVGAVHWGLALAGRTPWSLALIISSILPSVWAWVALGVSGERGLALLVAGFGLFWLYEHRWCQTILPVGYLRLRRELTLAVCTLLSLLAFAYGASPR